PDLLRQKSFGASITIRMACYSVAFYNSLLLVGKNKQEATEILYEICWDIYEKMGNIPMIIANIVSSNKYKKMEIATQIFRTFPFSPPDYIWEDIESDNNTVAFDCKQCRVAEYFMDNNIGDVCYNTWCKLDFSLAGKWDGTLERKGSIANGDKVCDFRWKTE
ncbi:MAG: L-2-amino-thiazoline-4-carboxylic acid hydrolase, partial [Chlorobi bacterium]|nr:L-2-amino-thiazoline-4-carboxylic acid hydrolase [Chlorobiota bacterium]